MQKITPFLWFNGQLEEAIQFYTSVFPNSRIKDIMRAGDAAPGEKGAVFSAVFELEGQEFMALNGGPQYAFTPAVSFFVRCQTQEEVDQYWEQLSAGGRKDRCGWLTDKYGLSWQIIPNRLGELLYSKDPQRSNNVMQAMLSMDKLDIRTLEEAYALG